MAAESVMNLADAHAFLGVSEKTLRNYCKAGKLPFHQERNLRGVMEYRFRLADLEAFLQQRGKNPGKTRTDAGKDGGKVSMVKSAKAEVSPAETETADDAGKTRQKAAASHALQPAGLADAVAHDQGSAREPYADQLITHLRQELEFLKEQLQEKDRQMATKDRQLERQLERISNMNETLASLAQDVLKR